MRNPVNEDLNLIDRSVCAARVVGLRTNIIDEVGCSLVGMLLLVFDRIFCLSYRFVGGVIVQDEVDYLQI